NWGWPGPRVGRSSRGCCGDDPARGARLARDTPPRSPGRSAGESRGRGERRGARPPRPPAGSARRSGAAGAREGCVSAGRRARAGPRAARGRRVHHVRVRGAGRGGRHRARGARRAHRGERAVSGLLERRPGLLVLVDPSRTTPAEAADVARAARVAGGRVTSVEAVSQTRPLPADKPELAAAHATAARLIGMRAIYLDAGSGAPRPVAADVIRACRVAVPDLTLFVGGGIKRPAQVRAARAAGADFVVVGTALEERGGS